MRGYAYAGRRIDLSYFSPYGQKAKAVQLAYDRSHQGAAMDAQDVLALGIGGADQESALTELGKNAGGLNLSYSQSQVAVPDLRGLQCGKKHVPFPVRDAIFPRNLDQAHLPPSRTIINFHGQGLSLRVAHCALHPKDSRRKL